MHRRSVLSGLLVTASSALAGCLDSPQSGESEQYHMELTVQNSHDRSYDVRVEMTDADGVVVFEQTFALGPGEGRGLGDDFPFGEYTLVVELPDRSQLRSFWNTDLCDVHHVRTEIAADGHVSHDVACRSEDGQ